MLAMCAPIDCASITSTTFTHNSIKFFMAVFASYLVHFSLAFFSIALAKSNSSNVTYPKKGFPISCISSSVSSFADEQQH
jgi:hypothetical protein